jgi:hypothetical protein
MISTKWIVLAATRQKPHGIAVTTTNGKMAKLTSYPTPTEGGIMPTTTQMSIAQAFSERYREEGITMPSLLKLYDDIGFAIETFISENDGSMLVLWQNKWDNTPLFVSLHRGHDEEYIEVFPSVGAWESR